MTPLQPASQQVLRMIDANLDRIGEGLRFLEDIARFVLGDAGLTQQLKELRHQLLTTDWPFQQQLLQARNSAADVGASTESIGDRQELPIMAVANARRVQEALRVMEELSSSVNLEASRFKQARFNLYELEKSLLSKLLRHNKIGRLSGLYVIIDTQALKGRSLIEAARQAIQGGAKVIQLRDRLLSRKELLPMARDLKQLCSEHNILFIVNNYLDLALAAGADGLHLGQNDLPVKVARQMLGMDQILGCSTSTVEQALTAESDGADYIAVGSIYPTTSKDTAIVIGTERLRQVRQVVSLPVVATGGINGNNVSEVIAAGASSVAVIGAVLHAEDITTAARKIAARLEKKQ